MTSSRKGAPLSTLRAALKIPLTYLGVFVNGFQDVKVPLGARCPPQEVMLSSHSLRRGKRVESSVTGFSPDIARVCRGVETEVLDGIGGGTKKHSFPAELSTSTTADCRDSRFSLLGIRERYVRTLV